MPVEFKLDSFVIQNGVSLTIWPFTLADSVQGAVVVGDDFVMAAAAPRARDFRAWFAGGGFEEKGF